MLKMIAIGVSVGIGLGFVFLGAGVVAPGAGPVAPLLDEDGKVLLRGDGTFTRGIRVPISGNGCAGDWSYVEIGSDPQEAMQDVVRVYSECSGLKTEKITAYARKDWFCITHQGVEDALCIAFGPGAVLPNGRIAPIGTVWFPQRWVYVGEGHYFGWGPGPLGGPCLDGDRIVNDDPQPGEATGWSCDGTEPGGAWHPDGRVE